MTEVLRWKRKTEIEMSTVNPLRLGKNKLFSGWGKLKQTNLLTHYAELQVFSKDNMF